MTDLATGSWGLRRGFVHHSVLPARCQGTDLRKAHLPARSRLRSGSDSGTQDDLRSHHPPPRFVFVPEENKKEEKKKKKLLLAVSSRGHVAGWGKARGVAGGAMQQLVTTGCIKDAARRRRRREKQF